MVQEKIEKKKKFQWWLKPMWPSQQEVITQLVLLMSSSKNSKNSLSSYYMFIAECGDRGEIFNLLFWI